MSEIEAVRAHESILPSKNGLFEGKGDLMLATWQGHPPRRSTPTYSIP
jgi:hypothetical protein